MSFSRKMLKALGIEDEKIDTIIEEHTAITDALIKERDGYKADADKLPGVEKQLNDLKGGEDYKKKYEEEHAAYESYKAQISTAESEKAKRDRYKDLLKAEGIDPKRHDAIMRVTDLEGQQIVDGKFADEANLVEEIRTDWAGFKLSEREEPARVDSPADPKNGSDISAEAFARMSYNQRVQVYNENPELYKRLTE